MSEVQIAIIDQEDTQITLAVPGVQGPVGNAIPSGGTTNQVLFKSSATNYDATWGNVTSAMITDLAIVDADVSASAAIVDTKLATIATAGKVSNSATTAASANTASAIVARDASGNFTAGTITAALTGAASSNVLKAGDTMTGVLAVTAGTAALPAITPSGDPNTGIYSPGADQLAVATNGTGRLFIDATGRVGVGTASPAQLLHVSGSGTQAIRFENTLGTGNVHLELKLTNNTFTTGLNNTSIFYNDTAGREYIWYQNSAERMRLDISGRLGIGTGSPTSGKLDIYHLNSSATPNAIYTEIGAAVYPGTNNMSAGKFVNNAVGANAYGIWAETTDAAYGVRYAGYFKCAGYVYGNSYGLYAENTMPNVAGAGTAYAGYFKVLSAGTGVSSAIYGLRVENTAAVGATSYGALISTVAGPTTVIPFRVDHAGSERLRIDSSGRLLVGTSTANANGGILQLSGGITFPATAVAATDANTLDDYEEGTWTPTQGANLTVVGTFSSSGTYTKIGRFVVARGALLGSTSVALVGSAPVILCAGLPFTSAAPALGNAVDNNFGQGVSCVPSTLSVYGSSAITATPVILFSVSYFV